MKQIKWIGVKQSGHQFKSNFYEKIRKPKNIWSTIGGPNGDDMLYSQGGWSHFLVVKIEFNWILTTVLFVCRPYSIHLPSCCLVWCPHLVAPFVFLWKHSIVMFNCWCFDNAISWRCNVAHSLELADTRSSLIVVGGSFVGLFSWGVWPIELTSGDGPTYEPSIFGGMPNGCGSQWLRNTEIASSNSFSSNFVCCCWTKKQKKTRTKWI